MEKDIKLLISNIDGSIKKLLVFNPITSIELDMLLDKWKKIRDILTNKKDIKLSKEEIISSLKSIYPKFQLIENIVSDEESCRHLNTIVNKLRNRKNEENYIALKNNKIDFETWNINDTEIMRTSYRIKSSLERSFKNLEPTKYFTKENIEEDFKLINIIKDK